MRAPQGGMVTPKEDCSCNPWCQRTTSPEDYCFQAGTWYPWCGWLLSIQNQGWACSQNHGYTMIQACGGAHSGENELRAMAAQSSSGRKILGVREVKGQQWEGELWCGEAKLRGGFSEQSIKERFEE